MVRRRRSVWFRRRGLLLAAVVVVIAATGVIAAFHGPQRAGYDGPWADQSRPGPVLLVPGYGGRKGALDTLATRLTAAGRTATVVSLPGDGTGDLTADARVLNTDVTAALRDGAPSVDLVGYSAGGVVVRLWINEYRRFDAVRRVVTLGSPLHGTTLAGWASVLLAGPDCPAACRQLAPFSDLIRDLNTDAVPARLPWVSAWSDDDTTVNPPTSARLAGAVNVAAQDICPHEKVSHSRLPTDPLLAGIVIAALSGPPWTSAPTRDDCRRLKTVGAALSPPSASASRPVR